MNDLMMNRLANIFDGVVAFFSKHVFWIHLLILWGISVMFTTESHEQSWLIFAPVFTLLVVIFSPTLIFAFFRNSLRERFSKIAFYIISMIVLIDYPMVLLFTNISTVINDTGVFEFHEAVHNNDDVVFYVLFYISLAFFILEVVLNFRKDWTYEFQFIKRIKKLTLEQTLLIILGSFAGLLSFVELISNNQGINAFSDIPRFFARWLFIGMQLFAIMFTYYLFYWINHYILINKVLKQKGILAYILSFLFVVAIGYPIAAQIAWWISSFQFFGMPPIIDQGAFDGVFFAFPVIEMLVSIPFILAIQWFRQTSEIATLEKAKSEAELTLLKQQINPHFFFNTLNNLYALSLKKDEATPEVILQLSELMRYVIYKGKEENVKLSEEVKYIEDYCELQQIRLHKNLDFRFTQNIEDETMQIPPLLFIILVENAFKHGIEPAENACYLHINLESSENGLTFTCENSYEEESDKPKGIGLDNLRKRLELRYPNQHNLEITDDGQIYRTILKVNFIN